MGSFRNGRRRSQGRGRSRTGGRWGRRSRQGSLPVKVPTGPALDLLKDIKKDFGTLQDAFVHVAEETGCSVAAIKRAYHSSRLGLGDSHTNGKLTPVHLVTLVAVAQAFSVNNVALSVALMRELSMRKWGVEVSRTCVTLCVSRHRRARSKRACKALADKRVGTEVFHGVAAFCEELTEFLKHNNFPAHAVFNFDETRIVQKGGNMKLSRVEEADKETANTRSTRQNMVASLMKLSVPTPGCYSVRTS